MSADDRALLDSMPIEVADRVMTAVYEGEQIDPGDAATLASWMQDACAVMAGVRAVGTMPRAGV